MRHPTDLELVDYIDDELDVVRRAEVAAHLDSCTACRALVDDADEALPIPQLRQHGVAEAPAAAVAAAFSTPPGAVERGGLWRVAWSGTAIAVIVVENRGADIDVIPALFAPLVDDDETILLDHSDTTLGVPVTAWIGLRRTLPVAAFSQHLADITPEALARVLQQHSRPAQRRRSPAAATTRAALVLALGSLQEARLTPPGATPGRPVNLAERINAAGLRPTELAARLGVPPAEITDVLRRRRRFSPDQATVVAELLGLEPGQVSASPAVDEGLLLEVQQPRWRALFEERARQASRSLEQEREAAVRAVLVMAARTTGTHRGTPDWAQLVGDLVARG